MPRTNPLRLLLLLVACWGSASVADAQLRIVSYNTLQGPNTGFDAVMEAIGEESYSGFSKPVDVLLLQEQNDISSPSGSTQQIVDILNGIYNTNTYVAGTQNSNPPGGIRQGIVYDSATVQLVDELAFGSLSTSGQARQTLRYQLRPVGYDSAADFYAYNNHYKASNSATDEARRLVEANAVRNNSDALGEGTHVIYAGDFNMYRSSEDGFQELISSGPGQAHDPINQIGSWHTNPTYAEWHTQSPRGNFGGMDDRFDFQLVTGEMLDGEGVDYIPGSYHTFGNNGSTYNDAITNGNTITFSGITSFTKSQVLNALESTSDHLPVVADYQIPAVLEALTGTVPTMLNQNQPFSLDLLVRNAANVLVAAGADELDFTFSTTGDLSGSGSGMALPLAAAGSFPITLDTSTEGTKSGSIIIETTSQGAANSFVNIPISYQVGEGSPVEQQVIARALFPNVADDINVTDFQFGGGFTTEAALPSDARTLAFSDPGDMFGIEDRNDDPPFSIMDDSAGSTPSDTLGIIGANDFDNFFGVVDLENDENSSALTAQWAFDISSATGNLSLSIDMAGMGDFEPTDVLLFETSIDGSPFTTAFEITVDDDGSLEYVMDDGDTRTENDPLVLDGTYITNDFQTFIQSIAGFGDELTLRFTAFTNSNSEIFAFRNIVIEGLVAVDALPGDYNGDGTVNMADYTLWRNSLGAVVEQGTAADGDGSGTIDAGDFQVWKDHFGESLNNAAVANSAVPEPAALVLLATGAVCWLASRNRRP
ncbi:dockerin type I domain-containing protein [Aeoliella sp.]|uniref:dockerin type I domain-containing protein n=1 Tax=Aeoliella sp. TaxID=2795800 RepID=UPI003CCB89DD